ncbi:MAG: histone deacetylase family protein [Pseudomonadota bacterium]
MKTYYSGQQVLHAPERELQNGEMVPYAEQPARVDAILSALGVTTPAADFGLAPILDVHDKTYVEVLRSAYRDWTAAGRPGDAFPYVFPVTGRRPLSLDRIDARLGQHAYDCGTPIAEHTWDAAYWNAQTALTGLSDVMDNKASAFALCRPPGHHAGADYMGGYCYLNNVAISAEAALKRGAARVAVLDVDYHHGNGTQDIFYARGDVLTVSIHADPRTDYPFYWGHADETGSGAGSGSNLNLPLPRGTDWTHYVDALDRACDAVAKFQPDLLIVPFGADTFEGDPISYFALQTADYRRMAERISELDLPSLICMEGGYAIEALGANVERFLSGFDAQNG